MGETAEHISRARFVATEPINFLIAAVQGALSTLRTFYVQDSLAQHYNYSINYYHQNGTCSDRDVTDPLEKQIQSETAWWNMWLAVLSTLPPVVTATFLVAASSFIGRKPILVIGVVCHLIAPLIFLLVALFGLPLSLTLLAAAVLGLCGDIEGVVTVSLAYVADSSVGKSRTQRMVVLSLMYEAGWGCGQTLGGLILGYSNNFPVSFAFPAILAAINLAYTTWPGLVLETVPKREPLPAGSILKKSLDSLAGFCTHFERRKRNEVVVLIMIICLVRFVRESIFDVVVIYGLGKPFCWTAIFVGCFNASVALFPAAIATILTKPLLKCFTEHWLIHFGFISFIAQLITCALAPNTTQLAFIASAVGLLRTLPEPLGRSLISRLDSATERDAAFAMLAVAFSFSIGFSYLFFDGQFTYTVSIGMTPVTFYVAAAILVIPMGEGTGDCRTKVGKGVHFFQMCAIDGDV
ncbi:lysosomal proton-coupled steroid conjugate and bile acid symporter SLC46A3-like [Diadema antillarum]|uniref:lysosomal proton-coupled steroid conjugate and bile acid symporter SLC46A3-like n=1 Tax=Diadema antillarum TaxID=105358 RepID=UPI003A88E2BC